MQVVAHCLQKWAHYVKDKHTKVYTDNISLKYFQTQPKLTPKQARWQDTKAEFDIELLHKPGKANAMPDALSRLPTVAAITTFSSTLKQQIKDAQQQDPVVHRMRNDFHSGKAAVGLYNIKDDIFYAHNRIYVSNDEVLKKSL
ncbi:hypothetical protein GOP47_0024076, partial [Adiantum capillus-veneris]